MKTTQEILASIENSDCTLNWDFIKTLTREELESVADDGTGAFEIVTAAKMEGYNEDGDYDEPDLISDYEATTAAVRWFEQHPDGILLQKIWNDYDYTIYQTDGTVVGEATF